MNYFKGSGGCGLSVSPNYKKIKENMEKAVLKNNASLEKNSLVKKTQRGV
jgi:hypothetical protein